MRRKADNSNTQIRIGVLDIFGIIFVVIGFILLFPFQGAPTRALYLTPSNAYTVEIAIFTGIIILIAALIAGILKIRKNNFT